MYTVTGNSGVCCGILVSELAWATAIYLYSTDDEDPFLLNRPWSPLLWPKLLNLPLSVPTWLAHRYEVRSSIRAGGSDPFVTLTSIPWIFLEVAVPTDFGLTYDDLELETPDKIRIRAYLLTQRKELPHAAWLETRDDMTDFEVRNYRVHDLPPFLSFHRMT